MISRGFRGGSLLGLLLHVLLTLQHHIAPAALRAVFLANATIKNLHPAFLVGSCVCVEIDDFTVIESDAESFFNKHVAFLLLCKARLATFSTFASCLFLCERTAIINQLASIGKIDGGTRLARGLVVGGQLTTCELEKAAAPVLQSVSYEAQVRMDETYRTITALLTEVSFKITSHSSLGFLHLSNTRIHALRHVLICGAFRLGDEKKL